MTGEGIQLRPAMVGILLTLILQFGAIVWWGARMDSRVSSLEVYRLDIDRRADIGREGRVELGNRATRLEAVIPALQEDVAEVRAAVARIESLMRQRANLGSGGPPGSQNPFR